MAKFDLELWGKRVRKVLVSSLVLPLLSILPVAPSAQAGVTTITAPQNITASANPGVIDLSWSAPATGSGLVTGYRVEYSTDGSSWTVATSSLSSATTTYSISGLTVGTAYYTRVAALFSGGTAPYGYPWTTLYATTTPNRSGNSIVYSSGLGLAAAGSQSANTNASAAFTRVRYRLQHTVSGTLRYVNVDFARWSEKTLNQYTDGTTYTTPAASIANLSVPSLDNVFFIQTNVSDLTVESSLSTLNDNGLSGRLEIWPTNYEASLNSTLSGGNGSIYDTNDRPAKSGSGSIYGSFQVHDLTNSRPVLIWNDHSSASAPDIGVGPSSCGNGHTDWTFCDGSTTNFQLQIFINKPITLTAAQLSFNANSPTSGTVPSTISGSGNVTIPANTGSLTRTGFSFSGWNTLANGSGTNYAVGSNFSLNSNITLFARWLPLIVYDRNGNTTSSALVPTSQTILPSPSQNTLTTAVGLGRDGYTFGGWNTSANGSGVSYPSTNTSLAGLPTPFLRLEAENFNTSTNQWVATNGTTRSGGSIRGTVSKVTSTSAAGTTATFPVVKGGTTAGITLTDVRLPDYTFCSVARIPTPTTVGSTTAGGRLFDAAIGAGNWLSGYWAGYMNRFWKEGWFSSPNTANDGNFHLICDRKNSVRWDGSLSGTSGGSTTDLPQLTINNGNYTSPGGAAASEASDWEVAEVLIYNTTLSDSQVLQIEGYLKHRYGLTGAASAVAAPVAFTTFETSTGTTLFAQWNSTITYQSTGQTSGTVPANSVIPPRGGNLALNTGNLVLSGNNLIGWNTQSNGLGIRYPLGSAYTPTGNTTLHAQYVPVINFPTVAYNPTTLAIGAGAGGRSETFTATGGFGARTFSVSPVRSGFSIDTSTANGVALVVSPLVANGTYLETITVTDAAGFSVNHVVTVTVASSVRFDTSTATTIITTHRKGASLRLNTVNGVGTKVFTMTPAAAGISLDTSTASSGFATLRVDTFTANGTFTQVMTVTDNTRIRSTFSVTIVVNAPPTLSSVSAIVTSPVLDSLRLNLDAGDRASYSGAGTTWTDLSSNGKNATWQVSPTWDSATGGIFNLNGSSQHATTSNLGAVDVFSVETWVKFDSLNNSTNYPCLVSDNFLGGTGGVINYSICFTGSNEIKGGYWRSSANKWAYTPGFTPLPNTWYHFVYTVSKSGSIYTSTLYQNGNVVGSTTDTMIPGNSGSVTFIGKRWGTVADFPEYIRGSIPIVRVYNRALSTTEVSQNYNAVLPRFTNNPTNQITITTTESITASSSIFYAGLGTGNKTFALSNATAGISIDTATANTVRVNLANTLSATSTTALRSISQVITATDTSGITAATPVYVTTVINPRIIITDATPGNLTTTFGRIAYDTFTATQGTGLKTFTVVSSSFPSAFAMTNPSANVGLLTVANNLPVGTYTLTITATDAVGATTNFALTVVVNPVPTIAGATGNTLTTTLGRPASLRVNIVGGTGTRTIAWTSPQAGITIDSTTLAAQNFITLTASSAVPVRTYSFSIAATDSSSARVADTFTVIVNRWPVIGAGSVVQSGLVVNLDASTYSGSGSWLDSSGFGRHAVGATASTTPNGTSPEYSTESGGIFSFNEGTATTNHMLIPNPGTLETFTVSAWIRLKSIPTNNTAIITQYWPGSGGSNPTINYVLAFSGSSIFGAYYRGASNWTSASSQFTPLVNTWYQVTYLVFKSGNNYFQDLYINGVKQGSSVDAGTIAPSSNGSVISLGRRWDDNTTQVINGAYGNVSIYNRALSATEIQQNYNAIGSRFISTSSGSETLTVTQGVAGTISSVPATQGTGTKTFTTTNANAGVTIDTTTANAFTLNLANTLTSTSATVARTITETVTATDAAGATTARVYAVVVNPPIRVESTTSTITTTSGILAWDTFTATQGTGLKTLTLTGTPSTAGFTLTQANSQAVLKVETTVNPGTYTLTILARDSLGATTSIIKTVVVNARPTITGNTNIAGTTGYAFSSQNYSAANGTGTLTYSITTVPATVGRSTSGITLSATTGTPTINVSTAVLPDTYTVTLRATDSLTAFGTLAITLRINETATITGTRTLTKVYGEDLSQVFATSGGTAPFNIFASTICTSEKSTFVGNGTNGTNGVTYTVEKFNGTGDCNWVVPANVSNASVLVVAGGGGGGSRHSGGGGGGGVMYATNYSLTPGSSYALSVGTGGEGFVGGTSSGNGNTGSNSYFGGASGPTSIVANGGGGSNANGGSGGGSNYHPTAAGTAAPGSTAGTSRSAGSTTMTIDGVVATVVAYGQSGAVGLGSTCKTVSNSNGWCGGGGGGASSAGNTPAVVSGNQYRAGNGGNGVALDFTGSSATYAGGGGGGAGSDTSPYANAAACFSDAPREGYGGAGGGGNGSKCLLAAANGTDGLGGGGGGGGYAYYGGSNQNARGGNGGSGTVIVRYVTPAVDTQSARITMDTLLLSPGVIRLNAPRLLPVNTYTQTIRVRDSAATPVETTATVNLTVVKATPTLSLSLPGSVATAKYGNPVTISAVATTPGTVAFVNGSTNITACTAVATTAGLATCSWTPTAVGATTLRATLTPTDTANFNSSAQESLPITVAKADTLTVTVTSLTRQFTGSAVSVTGAFTTTGLVAIDSLTAISMLYAGTANTGTSRSSTTAPTDAGTYTIAPNFPANANAYTFAAGSLGTTSAVSNYESVTVVAGTLTIARAPQVLSFTYPNSNTATYSPTGTITASATTRLDSAVRTYSSSTLSKCTIDSSTAVISIVEAGSCQVSMAVAQTFNYLADTATATVTINKASRTLVLTPGVNTLKFADTTTVTATLSGGAADGTISYTLGSPAGCTFDPLSSELLATSGTVQCPLSATISEGVNYLAETTTAISLTIARANAPVISIDTITALNHTPGVRALITPTFTITGLKNTDTANSLTYTYSFVSNPFETFAYSNTLAPTDAGTYRITPSALTLSSGLLSNYETPTYSSSAINVVINRIAQETVTILSVNSEVEVPFTLIATGGSTGGAVTFTKVSGANCSVTGTTLTATQAGSCMVAVTRAGNRNYLDFTSESVTVRVRNFVMVEIFVPSNPNTGITITPTVPLTKGPDVCTSGCVPKITSADVYDVAEGDLIVLTGINFIGVTKVYFNIYSEAPFFNVDSDTQLSVRVPADLPQGDATIEVVSPGGTSNRLFDFIILP
jgi:hypothetical protein